MHRKTSMPEFLFLKLQQAHRTATLKKRLWHRCFPVNFAKSLKTTFFIEHIRWVLLNIIHRRVKTCFVYPEPDTQQKAGNEDIARIRSSYQRCSIIKGVPKKFAKFTGKHLCQGLFFHKVAGLRLGTGVFLWILRSFKNTFWTEHLQETASVEYYFEKSWS